MGPSRYSPSVLPSLTRTGFALGGLPLWLALAGAGCAHSLGADAALGLDGQGSLRPQAAVRAGLGLGETTHWSAYALSARGALGAQHGRLSLAASLGPEGLVHRRRGALVFGVGATVESALEGPVAWGGGAHLGWLWRISRDDDPGRRVATALLGPELRGVVQEGPAGVEAHVSLGVRWVWEEVRDFVGRPEPTAPPPPP